MSIRNFFILYFLSFHSRELYLNIANRWKNWGLNFLLKFSFLCSLVISFFLFIMVAVKDFNELTYLFDQIPAISISQKEAHFVSENQEIVQEVKDIDNKIVAIVDLNISDPLGKYPETPIIFTKDRISFHFLFNSNIALYYADLKKFYNINILDSHSLIEILLINQKKLLISIPIIILPVLTIILLLLQFTKALICSAPALVISNLFNHHFKFKQIVRVAAVLNAPAESIYLISTFLIVFFIKNQFLINAMQLINQNLYLVSFITIYIYLLKKSN